MLRKALLRELESLSLVMVQGGLSSTTRTCGKPACPCHSDPARKHGPNLYFTWRADGRSQSLYVPAEHAEWARAAQAAWARFWEIGVELATANRDRMRKRFARSKSPRRKGAA
jgi:hypothetical protein